MSIQYDADVIVIGGGAAGTSTAINLARQGRHVLLLEGREVRQPILSDLHSGEVLSPGSQAELARLGLPLTDHSAGSFLNRWQLQAWHTLSQRWPDGRITHDELPDRQVFWQINRSNFYKTLQELARQAGVEVRNGVRVVDLLQNENGKYSGVVARSQSQPDGETVRQSLYAPVIVDASGRNSVVLARLALRQPEPQLGRAAYIFFFSDLAQPVEPGVWQQFWLPHATTLRGSQLAPNLYRYSFEMSLAQRTHWLTRYGRLAPYELFLKVMTELLPPERAASFQTAQRLPHLLAFAPIGYRVQQITHDGLLLVGDAAGYLDPSTGQGLEFALRMGRLAAHSLDSAFQHNQFDRTAFAPYLAGREAEVQPMMRNLRLLLRFSRQSWILNRVGQVAPVRRHLTRQLVTPRPTV